MADRDQRRRAIQEVAQSIALEASAGTGKTSTLIHRILTLVLVRGAEGGPVPLSQIAAITFTEKAAGELKVRLRQELEKILAKGSPVAERALRDLEVASISTIHSFAVALLKARPVEAEIDPRFTALDETASRLLLARVWDAWLERALAERDGVLERALRRGLKLEDLRELALELRQNTGVIDGLALDLRPGDGASARGDDEQLLYDVASWLRDGFLRAWNERKRADAVLDFDDQLRAARDLLQRSRAARRYLQERFRVLLIDEFQDTDPIQLEIALLLTSPDLDETDPGKLAPAPGRLFIVGDPKQSIYRFRGADIETYDRLKERPGLLRLELTRNYRSVPSILRFVDLLFSSTMVRPAGCRFQSDYLPFREHERGSETDPPHVHVLPSRVDDADEARTSSRFCKLEARRIARLAARIHGSDRWRVGDGESRRAPRFGDIAILLPVLTHVDVLEEALGEASVPYVLEGGKFYYARSEVSSAITVLGALANPHDQVALYGALRSIFFGLSDEDLLRARARGVAFDLRAEPPEGSLLAAPLALLRDLERRRSSEPPSEIFERLLAATGGREVLAARPSGAQSLANLAKLGRTLRALQAGHTFSETVELVAGMDEEEWSESESRILEASSDAVRILTIHKAKGLEFPIVIVAGLGLRRNFDLGSVLADRHGGKVWGARIAKRGVKLQSPRWNDLVEREKERQSAEQIRLLYVAMTRARDHLVLSTHASWSQDNEGTWSPRVGGTRLAPILPRVDELSTVGLARRIDVAELDRLEPAAPPRPDRPVKIESLEREFAELDKLRRLPAAREFRRPAAAAHSFEDPRDHPRADEARARGLRIGIAFHEAMEAADFSDPGGALRLSSEAASRHALDPRAAAELHSMLGATLGASLVARACGASAKGGRVLRELPFVRAVVSDSGPMIEEGRIDLLFEEAGKWVVVDYKTDAVPKGPVDPEAYFRERYSGQMLEYARAIEALGLRVQTVYVLLARTGAEIEIPLTDTHSETSGPRSVFSAD